MKKCTKDDLQEGIDGLRYYAEQCAEAEDPAYIPRGEAAERVIEFLWKEIRRRERAKIYRRVMKQIKAGKH